MLEKLYARGIFHALSSVLLIFLLFYVYSQMFIAPYIGFDFEPSTGEIRFLFVNMGDADLRIGDRIRQVNGVLWTDYRTKMLGQLFPPVNTEDIITIRFLRGDEERTVEWIVPGYNVREFVTRLFGFAVLGLIFWLAGVATILIVRPKDERWLLLIAFYFITATWITIGSGARWGIFYSHIVMRFAFWIAIPIYLHLHWVFPQPIRPLPWPVWGLLYFASLIMVGLQWLRLLPYLLAYTAFALTLLISLVLIVLHYLREPQNRRQIRTLTLLNAFGLLPTALLATLAAVGTVPKSYSFGLPFLILIPAAYFYAAYRRHFSEHSLRTNRAISLIIYLVLIALVGTGTLAVALNTVNFPGFHLMVASSFLVFTAAVSIVFFPTFQRAIERHLLKIPLAPERIAHTYAARITRSLDTASLTRLIENEVLSSLLIHQSALLIRRGALWQILYAKDVVESALLTTPERLAVLEEKAGVYLSPIAGNGEGPWHEWIRLALPLKFDAELVGWWLFGHRDPDSFYSPADVVILELLANQTAIAILNIEQAEQLRSLYEANIDRSEVERQELANTIHDEILRNLAILNKSVTVEKLPPEFEEAYGTIDSNLRRMTSRLRPVMLEISLYSALEEMADELEERMGSSAIIHFTIREPDSPFAYPSKVQEYLFRIVQNACENAVRYSQASAIVLSGQLLPHQIEVCVEDNGIGFDMESKPNFTTLLGQRRFGLVSMYERAAIIGAGLHIQSRPGSGTRVHLTWVEPDHRRPDDERKIRHKLL